MSASSGAIALVCSIVSAGCILLEPFEYDSSAAGGRAAEGGNGGEAPAGGAPQGGSPPCAVIEYPSGDGGAGCVITVAENVIAGNLFSDRESFAITRYAPPGAVVRLPKPGCSIPELQIDAIRREFAVVDPGLFAWTQRGDEESCDGSKLSWCDPRDCEPQEVPVLEQNPEFEKVTGMVLDDTYLYVMLTDGLLSRVRRTSISTRATTRPCCSASRGSAAWSSHSRRGAS